MKVSLRWLKTLTSVPTDLHSFSDRLDLTGTGVEGLEASGAQLDGVVVGQILQKTRLPESDHLWITSVDVGDKHQIDGQNTPLQIVCGAQNFAEQDKVAVALIGTTLPNGVTIKKTKMLGVESQGMNCSARELGLGDDHAGIMILPEAAPVGQALGEYLDLGDAILDLEITPNRPDCMSVLGVAREVAAIYDQPYRLPPLAELVDESTARGPAVSEAVKIQIAEADRCPRYTARLIRNVQIGPSPAWLAERLVASGARPLNNVVDVTNYIMFECGQPLHVFDYDQLVKDAAGQVSITIRAAEAGESFQTLDGVQRILDPDVTCIVDGNARDGRGETIALAGVMGGLASEVTAQTVNVLLESATFSAAHTSRTSRRLQLFSEASQRYERGVDDATCDEFSQRAAQLIAALTGGELAEGVVDNYPAPRPIPQLQFRVARFQSFVGAPIPAAVAQAILERLGCAVQANPELTDTSVLTVIPPSFRPDLEREIDLYEEVLRIWGMEKVPATLPGGRQRIGQQSDWQMRERRLGELLRAHGLNETMTYTMVPASDSVNLPLNFAANEQMVELINPMSAEMAVMRRTIIPGLLRNVAYNLNHDAADIQLYEMGKVFFSSEGHSLPREKQFFAAVWVGNRQQLAWNQSAQPVDFYDAKGLLETIGQTLHIAKLRFKTLEASEAPWLRAGRAASVLAGSSVIGWLGELHPLVTAAFEVNVPVVALELDYQLLLNSPQHARLFSAIPQHPAIQRDLAIVVDEAISAEQLQQALRSAGGNLLSNVELFDVFMDSKKLGVGKKSLAFSLTYQAMDRTLTSEEVDVLHEKIITKVQNASGGVIRS